MFSDLDAGARPSHTEVSAGSVKKMVNVGSATHCNIGNIDKVQFDSTGVEIDPKRNVIKESSPFFHQNIRFLQNERQSPCNKRQAQLPTLIFLTSLLI